MLGVTRSTSEAEMASQSEMVFMFKNGVVTEKWRTASTLHVSLCIDRKKMKKRENEMEVLACCFSQPGDGRITTQVGSVMTSCWQNPIAWNPQEELGSRKREWK